MVLYLMCTRYIMTRSEAELLLSYLLVKEQTIAQK
jgi:hypothetical protein